MKPVLFVVSALIFPFFAFAQQDVPACSKISEERPFAFGMSGQPLSKLSNSVFVAKKADIWIESEASNFKLWVSHNFKTGMKEFNCANLSDAKQKNFSFLGPVIYDNTVAQTEGSTVWQFQVLVRGMQLGLWNQKSSLVKIDQITSQKGASAWKWIEDGMGSVRLFKYEKIDGNDSVFVIDLEKTK